MGTDVFCVFSKEMIDGIVSVGCGELASVELLANLFASFSKKYPLVHYDLYTANADQIRERIDKGLKYIELLLDR